MYFLKIIVILTIGILEIVAMWKVFEKAGIEGWMSLIPLLNIYMMTRIAHVSGWIILLLMIPFVNIIAGLYLSYQFVDAYGLGGVGFLLYLFFAPIFIIYMGFSKEVSYLYKYAI